MSLGTGSGGLDVDDVDDDEVRLQRGVNDLDRQYMLDERAHVSSLLTSSSSALDELGLMLSEDVGLRRYWRTAAVELGLSREDLDAVEEQSRAAAAAGRCSNPGGLALKLWSQRHDSTIGALRDVIVNMRRKDVIDALDEFRLDNVFLTVVLNHVDGREADVFTGKCPSRKPIVEFIRPLILRRLGFEMLSPQRDRRVVIRLVGVNADGRGTSWASPAERFRGTELSLEKDYLPSSTRQELSAIHVRPRNMINIDRGVISWIDDVSIHFQTTFSEHLADSPPPSSPRSPPPVPAPRTDPAYVLRASAAAAPGIAGDTTSTVGPDGENADPSDPEQQPPPSRRYRRVSFVRGNSYLLEDFGDLSTTTDV